MLDLGRFRASDTGEQRPLSTRRMSASTATPDHPTIEHIHRQLPPVSSSANNRPTTNLPVLPSNNWILGFFFFTLATIFGYRTVLATCIALPIYLISFVILLIVLNVGISYWIQYQDYHPSSPADLHSSSTLHRNRSVLYDRLSFSTPAAYSAALIKRSWENETGWRKKLLHPSLKPKTSIALDRMITKILRDFVWKWYCEIVPLPPANSILSGSHEGSESSTSIDSYSSSAFPLAVEKTIRHSLEILFDRLGKVDVATLIIHKILPILTAHVEAFREAEYELRGAAFSARDHSHRPRNESRGRLYRAFFSSGNDEIDLLLSRLHADVLRRKSQESQSNSSSSPNEERIKLASRLHPAVDVPTPNSQSAELAHLRKLLENLLPFLLPSPESQSTTIKTLVAELLACVVIAPVIEMLSDSDFWNRLIEESAGTLIREQRMVEQLRQVLDRQLSFVTTSSKTEASVKHPPEDPPPRPRSASVTHIHRRPQATGQLKYSGLSDHDFTSGENISIKTTLKGFERFSRSIQRCNTLFDLRRLKNDVETQIRKAEAELTARLETEPPQTDKNPPSGNLQESSSPNPSSDPPSDLSKFLERLYAVRDILDQRLVELGGSSGPVQNSWTYDLTGSTDPNSSDSQTMRKGLHKHLSHCTPSQILQEVLRDRESPALSYFTEFMDRRQRVELIQFWLAVEGLKNPLEEDLVSSANSTSVKLFGKSVNPRPYARSLQDGATSDRILERDIDAMTADIKAIAEINFSTIKATDLLGLKKEEVIALLRFLSLDLAHKYESTILPQFAVQSKSVSTINSVKEARAYLFTMQRQVFELMLSEDFPAFAAAGDLYLRATASLCGSKSSNRPNPSPTRLTRDGSFPNLGDLKSSLKGPFGFSPSHTYSAVVKPHHFSDPDSSQSTLFAGPGISQPIQPTSKDFQTSTLVRAQSFNGSLPQTDIRLSPEHNCDSPRSVTSSEAVTVAKSKDMRKSSPHASNIIHTVLRSNALDMNQHLRRIAPSPVPPQVTLQEAFDERLPGERLTGPTQYHEPLFSLSNYTFPDQLSSSQSSLKIRPEHLIHAPKFSVSSSLDFLISPSRGDRAPLFGDDLNFSIRKAPYSRSLSLTTSVDDNPKGSSRRINLASSADHNLSVPEPKSRGADVRHTKHAHLTSPDAAVALQEALSSIISTSDSSPRSKSVPSPHQHSYGSHQLPETRRVSDTSPKESMSNGILDPSLETRKRKEKIDLFASSYSAPASPLSKPLQRKRLFDDEDEDENDEGDMNHLQSFEPNNQLSSKRRKHTSLFQETIASTSAQSTVTVSNISEADERIMKLENELNLLSSLMRRAELTGNNLEIRLVRKSIESVGRELSEVIYRKTKLIEAREILLGGFRGKLVPGRVKISITGTTVGNSNASKDNHSGLNQPSHASTSPQKKNISTTANNKKKLTPPTGLSTLSVHPNGSQQEFVLYKIEVHKLAEDGSFGSGWIVYRRYSEFDQLNKMLKESYPISRQLEFPTKLFGLGISTAGLGVSVGVAGVPSASSSGSSGSSKSTFNQSLIDQRRVGLERYLKALIQIPVLCESPELAKFLSRSKNQDSLSSFMAKGAGTGMDSIASLKKRIEFFSSTTGFVRSIYKSVIAGSSISSASTADSHGNRIFMSSEEDNALMPISSSTSNSLPHPHSFYSSPSFSFSSQSFLDVFMKGFYKTYPPTHHHQDKIDDRGNRYDGKMKDSIEINVIKKKKQKLRNTQRDHDEDDDDDEEEEEEEEEDGYVNVEQDRLVDLTNNIKPIEGELLTHFTKPISNFLIEIFELNDQNQWLRKQGIVIVLQQILGGTIERKFKESISELLEDEQLSQIITNLEQSIWLPDGEDDEGRSQLGELRPKPAPRSIEEKIITCDGAYRKLSVIIPDYAASILGRSNARMATRRLFSMLQNRRLNKHLIYTILDEVIKTLFPELIDSL